MERLLKTIEVYRDKNGRSPYEEWLQNLPPDVQDKITAQVHKLALAIGDVKSLGGGLFECRIHFGPGFRVYFANKTNVVVLLLVGSLKKDQSRTIHVARTIIETELR